jgi:TRAP-type C4-dicarboxylate transport system permease small subunit
MRSSAARRRDRKFLYKRRNVAYDIYEEGSVNRYKKTINLICAVFEVIAALSLGAMLVVVAIQVVLRYFFNNAPGWSEELARQFMILFCFIAMALGVRETN